jgi:hypothetical protein
VVLKELAGCGSRVVAAVALKQLVGWVSRVVAAVALKQLAGCGPRVIAAQVYHEGRHHLGFLYDYTIIALIDTVGKVGTVACCDQSHLIKGRYAGVAVPPNGRALRRPW